ncbi:MAG: Bug family tripartite tricarboxylate transporter substrate binding protein [Burkholderiales bacterium]
MRRVHWLITLLVAAPGIALAQYPTKPIRLIVPFPPAGAAELGARIFAQPLGQALGQPVVIDTRPGGDGVIAAEAVIKAAPDGYTLFYGTNTALSWVPALRKSPPYDPMTDFTPVSLVGHFGFFLFSHPSIPVNSVSELIAYARANPGKLNYGTGNSFSMLTSANFTLQEKLDVVHVPYKGDGPLSIDLLAGRVQMAFATPGTAVSHVKEGRLRALATLLPSRSPLFPDVPTAAEAGLVKAPIVAWGGLFGPARMPKEIVDRLAREMAALLPRPEIREAFGRLAFEPRSSTPQELAQAVAEQLEAFKKGVKDAGIAQE